MFQRNLMANAGVFFIVLACLAPSACLTASHTSGKSSIATWHRWEGVLTARRDHPRPYAVEVNVAFSGPQGAKFQVPAFWDGGRTYRFRAAFPRAGAWRWQSACAGPADAGLHGQSGRIHVQPYTGVNPLYLHGDLNISEDRRYLVHADGTPFLWMGDTGWNAAWKSTPAEWRDYVDARARQRFSLLQVHATGTGRLVAATPASGQLPFLENGAPNPAYWSGLEEKIAYANDRGLTVLLVGVGKNKNDRFAAPQTDPAFARYLAGRFAGHFVIFSPSMDHVYEPKNDEIGAALHRLSTHLVCQHPATNFEAAKKYHDADYAGFCGLQSGHQGGKLPQAYHAARAWTLELWNRPPLKPVINIEAMYDAYGHNDARNWRERDARKLGWISWLSGSMGYTYGAGDVPPKAPGGAGGVWRFSDDPAAYDHWRKALAWPSAAQMTILRDFMNSMEWWRLEPAHDLIKNQSTDETRMMVAARSRSGNLLLAYLPDNPQIILDLMGFSAPWQGHWFNPVTGERLAVEGPVMPGPALTFTRPAGWEDAMLLLRSKS